MRKCFLEKVCLSCIEGGRGFWRGFFIVGELFTGKLLYGRIVLGFGNKIRDFMGVGEVLEGFV